MIMGDRAMKNRNASMILIYSIKNAT